MTVDEIRELIALATESGIAELEVQRGDNRVRIRRSSFTTPPEIVVAAPSYASASGPSALAATPPSPPLPVAGAKEIGDKPHDPNLALGKALTVGSLYDSTSPAAHPFVLAVHR